jgi:hypothetical protein
MDLDPGTAADLDLETNVDLHTVEKVGFQPGTIFRDFQLCS